jgi:hypothetical protein
MTVAKARVVAGLLVIALISVAEVGLGDEAPITGIVKAVDAVSGTLTVETRAKGTAREVMIEVRPSTKVVRFAREGGGGAFKEQPMALEAVGPGWTVSVTTRHEGTREVAELVRVLHEKR